MKDAVDILNEEIERLQKRVAELERRDQRGNELFGELFDMTIDQAVSQKENAERYQIVRVQHWESSPFAVVMDPKNAVKLGYDCPSEERLDEIVDGLREPGEPL